MSDREKLIEMLARARTTMWGKTIPDIPTEDAFVADHLISNGVTVQKWIPVGEKLPKFGQSVLVSCAGYEVDYVTAMNFWSVERDEWQSVTHWMPLPEPPKECE